MFLLNEIALIIQGTHKKWENPCYFKVFEHNFSLEKLKDHIINQVYGFKGVISYQKL